MSAAESVDQAATGAPNQYHLAGGEIAVSYYPDGLGPIKADGP